MGLGRSVVARQLVAPGGGGACGLLRVGAALATLLLPAVLVMSGCTPSSEADVRTEAQRFQSAVRTGDVRAACGMLADEARSSLESTSARSCPDALNALHLSSARPTAVQVWGDNGQARLPGGALFLAEFPSGWKITAAGCRPRPDRPYSCSVRS